MASAKRWIQFSVAAGGFIGLGVLFVNYGVPSDDDILKKMSPELKLRYEKEKRYRQKASEILEQRIKENVNKPAWLQGSAEMRKLDREIAAQAMKIIDGEDMRRADLEERERLRKLGEVEKTK